MNFTILHESRSRIRIRVRLFGKMTAHEADLIEYGLQRVDGISSIKAHERTSSVEIRYSMPKEKLISELLKFHFDEADELKLVPEHTGREVDRKYEDALFFKLSRRMIVSFLLPMTIRQIFISLRVGKFLLRGLRSLRGRKLKVELLDAIAILVSYIRKDYKTANSVMFLLSLGGLLEEWTHQKSVSDLARSMSLNVERVWRIKDGREENVSINEIENGDIIVLRSGSLIPLDGIVESGEGMVNQAAMTGESLPVRKAAGLSVYAGTVVSEGELKIRVSSALGGTRYEKIVKMIEESEKLKSELETRAFSVADSLVPYSFAGTLLTYLITRNFTRAVSVLMVDFSCALKLSMPVAVLSAMRQAGNLSITVKGGKYLEAVSDATTIVFDKTGTLTHACPKVAGVVPFNGENAEEMLRLAACLEEHFPHSIANAVVKDAKSRGLSHEEMHTEVKYVVAHGIASTVDGKNVLIGSRHFIFEDESCAIADGDREKYDSLDPAYSHLYLAIGGILSAVILIDDPMRPEVPHIVEGLKALGFENIVMMTGDSRRTAERIASEAGVSDYYAEVLPEDKAAFIEKEHAAGRKVVMVGDGINDSPALSRADAGIAISDGAQIAREVADITISSDSLNALLDLKSISNGLIKRVEWNYRFVVGFNLALILLGIGGVLTPSASALLHNASTIGVTLYSMTDI
ncbi:MAG: heavy metal translocating P-type ATPase [Lachnospiraceae bacterium]|nr:heavy metal translocating P-type ATPase [Lachnospiraceae bacterium]